MIYTPPEFANENSAQLFKLMRENAFATLVSTTGSEPSVTHLPVLVDESAGNLQAHVARANPVWRDFSKDRELLFIFHGPHHYVSPSWYTRHPSVPTWNYAVVHAKALPRIIEDQRAVEALLRRLVDEYESKFTDQWKMDLPGDYMRQMINGIVAFEARITHLQGKFKLSQNRPPADRLSVIAALQDSDNTEADKLAKLMYEFGEN